jgi:ATP-dependent helicase HrpB
MSTEAAQALPVAPALPRLSRALAASHAVLVAPTGSGKTTAVPLALLEADWLKGKSILMLEPRRPAARMAAARMAALLGEQPGERVGYQVRFERRIGRGTRIEVLTEGILTRRIQHDPELSGYGLLIFDEFHERSLDADLALALALDATALRSDLRILVMSATLDADAVATLLGNVPVIEARGRSHPVEVIHETPAPPDPLAAVPGAVRRALARHAGDILVFLPGAAEIARTGLALADLDGIDVLPLHGALPVAEQDRALRPPRVHRRRVVLSTDIAETSVTIEGITVVIDTGLTRKPRFDPGSGLTRLVVEPIAQASAEQRAGRAGRLGPGICYRLWPERDHRRRPHNRPAEILQADLAPPALQLALWGIADPTALRWIDSPPAPAWGRAVDLLRMLGAIDTLGAITPTGRRMAGLPAHPRLARMLIAADSHGRGCAADLAALIGERDPHIARPGLPRPVDLGPRLAALDAHRHGQRCDGYDRRRLAAVARAAEQFRRRLDAVAEAQGCGDDAAALLALAYPERIAGSRGRDSGEGRFLMASGAGAVLPRDDPLGGTPFIVIADLDAASGDNRIRAALAIDEAALRTVMAEQIERRQLLRWDDGLEAVVARNEEQLGALTLTSTPAEVKDLERASALLLAAVARDLDAGLTWTAAARQLQARVMLARRMEPDADWPDVSERWLSAHPDDWLAPWLAGRTRLADARALTLEQVLRQLLGRERMLRLDALAPPDIPTPAGTRRRIDYCAGDEPVLAAPMQELFGCAQTPTIFRGRLPLLVHLLSPARRPLQITSDLAGFWRGAYAQVRKEMRGRYPKHHWPEDPAAAEPVAGGLRRRG